jgi:sulfonate transport system permease protein
MNDTENKNTTTVTGKIGNIVLRLILPVSILLVWEVVCRTGLVDSYAMPAPETVIKTAWESIRDGSLWKHILTSFFRVHEGFMLAVFFGLVIGTIMGLNKKAEQFFEVTVQILKPIPPIAWIPLAILWFGIGEQSKLFIIFLGAFFPILLNTISGIHNLDPRYLELAEVYEVDRRRLISKIILPGALPEILTGIRVGLGNAWVCVVAAEMIAASQGIGYMLSNGRSMSRPDIVILGMLLIGIIGKLVDDLLKFVFDKLVDWT